MARMSQAKVVSLGTVILLVNQ